MSPEEGAIDFAIFFTADKLSDLVNHLYIPHMHKWLDIFTETCSES